MGRAEYFVKLRPNAASPDVELSSMDAPVLTVWRAASWEAGMAPSMR